MNGISMRNEEIEQEGALDWVRGIGSGAATGADSGASFGPWGALIGGLAGGAMGAVRTAQRSSSGAPPPAAAPASAPAASPSRDTTGTPAVSPLSPQVLQQLNQLIPLLTELLTRSPASTPTPRTARTGPGGEAGDDAFRADWEREEGAEDDRSIEGPIPDEDEIAGPEQTGESPSLPEYPLATRFVPAKYFDSRSTPRRIQRVVIHITDGGPNINGTINWFRNPMKDGKPRKVSAHYIVGRNGEVVQMVRENDVAWHAGAANGDSIGIEHNARAPRSGRAALYPTAAQYCSSAALVRWVCGRYGIPLDRVHILGHAEADSSTKHSGCPNSVWNWDYHMSMVRSSACLPPPEGSVSEEEDETAETFLEDEQIVSLLERDRPLVDFTHWSEGESGDIRGTVEWISGEGGPV